MNKKILINFYLVILICLLNAEFNPNKLLAQHNQITEKSAPVSEIVRFDKEKLKEITILYCSTASRKDFPNLKSYIVTLEEYKKIDVLTAKNKVDKRITDLTASSTKSDKNKEQFDIDVGETFSFLYEFNYNHFAQTFPDYVYKMKLAIKDFDSIEIKDGRGLVKVKFIDGSNDQLRTFYFIKNAEEEWKIYRIF